MTNGWRPESDPLPWPGGKKPEYVPEVKRFHALTLDQFINSYLDRNDDYNDAFQFRDWDTVARLQDEAADKWKEGELA